jgi:hypothetical protein
MGLPNGTKPHETARLASLRTGGRYFQQEHPDPHSASLNR